MVDHFGLDPIATDRLFESLGINLKNGIFQFIALVDNINPRPEDLILFINQNARFNIYGIELKHYKIIICEMK